MRSKSTIHKFASCFTVAVFFSLFSLQTFAAGLCEALFSIAIAAPVALPVGAVRPLESVSQIKVMAYNVENLFLANESSRAPEGKPVEDQQGVARAIADENPDFVVLEEVGGIAALNAFSKTYLNDVYETYLVHGNDEGGIDIGYLVKRDLPLQVTLESHQDTMWTDPTDHKEHRVFSRDLPALLIRSESAAADSAPLFILMGNHAKAMRDRDGDPKSELLRAAQYQEMGRIIDGYRSTFGADVPLLLGGDFNADVQHAHSIDPVRSRMTDPFDVKKVVDTDRITHTFHPRSKSQPSEYAQLDALLVSPSLASNVIEIETYRYKDQRGEPKPLPTTYKERAENPSDHFPVVLTLSTKKIFPAKAAGF